MKKIVLGLVVGSLVLSIGLNVGNAAILDPDIDRIIDPEVEVSGNPKVEELKKSLEIAPNYLQYTEYKMLRFKEKAAKNDGEEIDYYNDYRLQPKGSSPLSLELSGGRESAAHSSWAFTEGLNVLTGAKAIDESLQLGSIGFNGGGQSNSDTKKSLDIAGIEKLSIKSHPWEEMIKGKTPQVPDIFSLVPRDYFMVYFRDMEKFTELEDTLKKIAEPLEKIYSLENSLEFKKKMFKRLGIKDIKILREFIDEAVMVSYDFDAYPNTDYALVLKLKNELVEKFVGDFVAAPVGRHGKIADYYVIATSEELFQKITDLKDDKGGQDGAMAEAPDLKYALSVLENDYDGFVFISEDLVKKLTGPEYRINARRRNTITAALETLQYVVFAYRDITGQWPKSIYQIVNEDYIAAESVADIDDYEIGADGIVVNKEWGSVYDVKPVSQVAIDKVGSAEKDFYDNFRKGYESYWVEFIDPVGVAITVGDQIRLHTIILPLIDESDYNWWKSFAAGDPASFKFINNPAVVPSFEIVSKFNIDDILYAIYQENMDDFGEEYVKCRKEYYEMERNNSKKVALESGAYNAKSALVLRQNLEEYCKKYELGKDEAVKEIQKKLADFIGWEGDDEILSFVGDEVALITGESFEFKIGDLSRMDIYLGLKLKDMKMAKDFLDQVFKTAMNSSGRRSGISGLLAADAPIRNEYQGVEFFMIPTGLSNIFYIFIDDTFYLTISQQAINKIIDGQDSEVVWQSHMSRLFDYIGNEQNIMAIADFEKMQKWLKGLLADQGLGYFGAEEFRQNLAYYIEALALAEHLPKYDGTTANVSDYYRYVPKNWFDAEFYSKDGIPYVKAGGSEYDARTVDSEYGDYFSFGEKGDSDKVVKLAELTKKFDLDANLEKWNSLKDFGVGLQFTKEGLNINLAFNNLENDKVDERIELGKGGSSGDSDEKWSLSSVIIGGALILAGVILFIINRRKQ